VLWTAKTEVRSNLKAIIFDHSVLLGDFAKPTLDELRKLLPWMKSYGLDIVVFSTNPYDVQRELERRGLPRADLFLTIGDVKAKKGSDKWVNTAAERLGMQNHQCVYVGDDEWDWKSAVNAATCYLQAAWAGTLPARMSALRVDRPNKIRMYLTHYLFTPPRWTYSLQDEDYGLYFRSLLPAPLRLPSSAPSSSFDLRDIFTRNREVLVGGESARNLLMLHALSSLYLEGLIEPRSLFAVYPSHTPGEISAQLQGYLAPAASFFGAYFREDLLLRWAEAVDTSQERASAYNEGRSPRISLSDQTDTVCVNPKRWSALRKEDRNVVVFDDFANSGMSLEWARNLLYAAGAAKVIVMTIGKYGRTQSGRGHQLQVPLPGVKLHPYERCTYEGQRLFRTVLRKMQPNEGAEAIIRTSFQYLKEHKNYPISRL
jgi:hypothetical protein